ncbi:small oligopeptide transporter [Lentinula aff. lateritia]|uniref:Small oligopeptide transporter n=1 Tax=Lentinula aff. lateritia TaxID=2804960 RepID=A0ACC1U903_9AGAR|nr:small oligopeptide transporter [Lentinula aff. lateritia]
MLNTLTKRPQSSSSANLDRPLSPFSSLATVIKNHEMNHSAPVEELNLRVHRTYTSSDENKSEHSVLADDRSDLFDPNFDFDAGILEEDSPYAEVRSAVANFDDPDMPVSTIRAWVLGIIWTVLLAGINQVIVYRFPSILITNFVALLVIFPCGQAWARVCPSISVLKMPLNPGPFSIKEHVLSSIMASVAAQSAYSTDIIAVQRVFYVQWMLTVSTQLIGLSLGGVMHRFLVAPPSMIWPNTLVQCALLNTLHSQQYAGIGRHRGPSRERFFLMGFIGAVLWTFLPSYLFTALRFQSGLGLSMITFDWNQIAYIGSPLATPWWSEANVVVGFILFYVIITPIFYYTNVWYSQYLPMVASHAFDNTGNSYNLTRVLTNGAFNLQAYKDYSPLYLPMNFVIAYGLSFIAIGSTVTHGIIYLRKPTLMHFRRSLQEQPDIHARLMTKYAQVRGWYYACVFVVTFAMACLCIELWPTGMSVWELLVALGIAGVLVLPIAMIQAVTNRQIPMNVFTELISGFLLPGQPVAMMLFKTFGYITTFQAIAFTQDFKLGHYMKIPPLVMFWAQIASTLIAGSVQLGVQMWLFANVPDMCSKTQKDQFTCQNVQVFGTASIIWGAIGSRLQFTEGHLYYRKSSLLPHLLSLMYCFLIGAACPAILWALTKKFPRSKLGYVNFPVIFGGPAYVPPANSVNYLTWAFVGFIFQHLIRRRRFLWWAKYNYVLSAALDGGTAVGVILIYFCLQYPLNGTIGINTIQKWWGNTVYTRTLDWKSPSLKILAPGETFGPPP